MTSPAEQPLSTSERFRKAILHHLPWLLFLGVHRYTVSRDNGDGTVDLAPAPKVLHGPHLRVGQYAAPGIEAVLSVGDLVGVMFFDGGNGDCLPAIVAHGPLARGKPSSLRIDVAGAGKVTVGDPLGSTKAVARVTDSVVVHVAFNPGTGGATLADGAGTGIALTGTITSGSAKLQSE